MKKVLLKTDHEIFKAHHQFVRPNNEEVDPLGKTDKEYGDLIAKRYYDKLYKEFAIVDLSNYKTGQIGMRWCMEEEVLIGKGNSICGNKKCKAEERLSTWEVNFRYQEDGCQKNALVKVRCCQECSAKLNHKKQHTKVENTKVYSEQDVKRMLKKLEARGQKIKKEEA